MIPPYLKGIAFGVIAGLLWSIVASLQDIATILANGGC